MYTTSIYRAYLRASHRWCATVYFSIPRSFSDFSAAAISTPRHRHGKCNPQNFLRLAYSTSPKSLDMAREDAQATGKPAGDIAVMPPPDDLMQSLDEEEERKLKILWMELEVFRQQGRKVPRTMSVPEWQEAMEQPSRSQRCKFYRFLCINEARKQSRKLKQAETAQVLAQSRVEQQSAHSSDYEAYMRTYGLYRNTIFPRIENSTMDHVYNSWQCQAMLFGPSIVVDLSYAEHMAKFENNNCAKQISNLYNQNKINRKPFHLHLCNAGPNNKLLHAVEKSIRNLYSSTCLMTVTEKSYTDIFPRDKLVYLTPHCENDLEDFDHDAVYIIGGFVDKRGQPSVSLTKAKQDGIATARLPLDRYLNWGAPKKALSLVGVMQIMLDIKNTGCWRTALRHIPKYKLKDDDSRDPIEIS